MNILDFIFTLQPDSLVSNYSFDLVRFFCSNEIKKNVSDYTWVIRGRLQSSSAFVEFASYIIN